MNKAAVARGLWNTDPTVFTPGMAWLTPWYFDPTSARERANKHVVIKEADRGQLGFLSEHYWRDHAHSRPPMTIVCPNGEWWEVDRKSSNGTGWTVTGEWPRLTVSPSIVVEGYHGFLRDGVFTADLDGRPPNGVARPYAPRSTA